MLLTLIALGISASAESLTFMDESQYGVSDIVDPVLIHSAHIRQERSAAHIPDVLHFRFELSDTEVSLNLTRGERDIESYPVYLTDERGTVLQTDLPHNENAAVYRDSAQGSAAIITRKTEDVYQLAGTIQVNNQAYKIWPQKHHVDKRQASASRNPHELREIVFFDMSNDTVGRQIMFSSHEQAIPSNVQGMSANDPAHYTIELALFPDFSDYTAFLNDAGGNTAVTISNMRLYYAFVEEMMQIRYDTVNEQDSSISITVWTKYIEIATSAAGSPWTETTRNGSVVPAVPAFINLADSAPRPADAYLIFTRYRLTLSGSPVLGAATFDNLCQGTFSFFPIPISININTPDNSAGIIAAHELGHNLGLSHDSVHDSGNCTSNEQFVMAATLGFPSPQAPSNPWTFSSCSVETLKTSLSSPEKAYALNTSISGSILSTNGQRAGQTINGDQQCTARLRSPSSLCRDFSAYENGTNFESLCGILYCSEVGSPCFGLIPLDQTSCGDKKWCERGVCVYNALAPPRSAKCPQGDDPNFGCQAASCMTYTTSQLLSCCASCAAQIPQKKTTVRFIVLRAATPIIFLG